MKEVWGRPKVRHAIFNQFLHPFPLSQTSGHLPKVRHTSRTPRYLVVQKARTKPPIQNLSQWFAGYLFGVFCLEGFVWGGFCPFPPSIKRALLPLQWLAPQFGTIPLSIRSLPRTLSQTFLNLRRFYLGVLGLGAPLSSPT